MMNTGIELRSIGQPRAAVPTLLLLLSAICAAQTQPATAPQHAIVLHAARLLDIKGGVARLGFEAPASVHVWRKELEERQSTEGAAAEKPQQGTGARKHRRGGER